MLRLIIVTFVQNNIWGAIPAEIKPTEPGQVILVREMS